MSPIAVPAQPDAIPLGTGHLPGAQVPESWHSQYGSTFARNVTAAPVALAGSGRKGVSVASVTLRANVLPY